MKYSRQREVILQTVVQNPIHPTADTVYAMVREKEPNISLGTVYRNLNLLSEQGYLLKICIPNASDRFDGRTEPHQHILCERCGQLYDIDLGDLSVLNERIANVADFTVTGFQVLLTGICPNCKELH